MSRTYDNVAPSVIDDEMLQIAVEEQGPKDEAGRIAKAEGIDFADVKALRLDFKSNYYVVMGASEMFVIWRLENVTKHDF